MPRVFISPCGTSLLTNVRDGVPNPTLRQLLLRTANAKADELTTDEKAAIDELLHDRRQLLQHAEHPIVKQLSAELNGILTDYGATGLHHASADYHYLLCTDTYQGVKVAHLIGEWLRDRGVSVEIRLFRDLSTRELGTFRLAMSDVVQWCDRTLTPWRDNPVYRVTFNLTGGFKSVNGFLQAVGTFYADECVYIFQSSQELLRIPRLPLSLDPGAAIAPHQLTFRKLARGIQLPAADCSNIPETLLFEDDDRVGLSEWGELLWRQVQPGCYERELLPPLSDKLAYSARFRKTLEKLPRDRRRIVNERLDDLSLCLDSNRDYNPTSLDFKALRGKPFADSTHECDAWSDADAKRMYGHYLEDGRYQIDRLDKHLR